MAATNNKKAISYAKAAIPKKIKMGARTVVSQALVKRALLI